MARTSFCSQFVVTLVFVSSLVGLLSPALSLISGLVVAICFKDLIDLKIKKISKPLLQVCVALLGFGIDLNTLAHAGGYGLGLSIITIFATLFLGNFIGRTLTLNKKVSTLLSAGTAICGGSAIAAVGTAINATASEISVAIATVFLLNAAALLIFPIAGNWLQLSQHDFGLWAGIAIHDLSSVVGAAGQYGAEALQIAVAVKLARTLWIIPLVFLIGSRYQRSTMGKNGKGRLHKPYFIIFFLLASLARSAHPVISIYAEQINHLARAGFNLTLFLIGTSIEKNAIREVGWRVVAEGVLLWLFITLLSLCWILIG